MIEGNIMKIGFTGTQHGMTIQQFDTLYPLLKKLKTTEFHHGDCIGADADATSLVHDIGKIIIHCHPPKNKSKRAFTNKLYEESVVYGEKEYLTRNKDIVDKCDILIAMPKEFEEELRSGTWATIRYARKNHKKIYIIYPDGSIKEEN